MLNPEIRFKDDNKNWLFTNFENIYIKASEGGTPSTNINAFYENGTIPFVKIEDTEQKYIEKVNNFINELGLKNSSAWLVPKDSIIFTNGATVGNVSINKIPVSTKQGILSIIIKKNFDLEFIYYILTSKKFQKEVNMRKTKGTFETIILKYLNEIKIKYPNIEVQKEISSLLSDIDSKISNEELLIKKLKDTKSSLLFKMFPQENQSKPDLRFKNYSGHWSQCKFENYFKMQSGYAFKCQDYCLTGVPLINGESIQHGKIDDSNLNYLPITFKNKYNDFILHNKDIVVGLNRPITNGNLKIAKIPYKLDNSLLYQRAGKIQYIQYLNKDFSYNLLSKEILKFTLKEAIGSDQPFISTSKLNKWEMKIPTSIKEQDKIGNLFESLDSLITLHQRKLEKLKQVKLALLDKLLV